MRAGGPIWAPWPSAFGAGDEGGGVRLAGRCAPQPKNRTGDGMRARAAAPDPPDGLGAHASPTDCPPAEVRIGRGRQGPLRLACGGFKAVSHGNQLLGFAPMGLASARMTGSLDGRIPTSFHTGREGSDPKAGESVDQTYPRPGFSDANASEYSLQKAVWLAFVQTRAGPLQPPLRARFLLRLALPS